MSLIRKGNCFSIVQVVSSSNGWCNDSDMSYNPSGCSQARHCKCWWSLRANSGPQAILIIFCCSMRSGFCFRGAGWCVALLPSGLPWCGPRKPARVHWEARDGGSQQTHADHLCGSLHQSSTMSRSLREPSGRGSLPAHWLPRGTLTPPLPSWTSRVRYVNGSVCAVLTEYISVCSLFGLIVIDFFRG
jgi:hypothetical protein